MYSIEIEKNGQLNAEGHSEGSEEFLIVYQGELTVRINGEEWVVHKGDSIRFRADKPHDYYNFGDELVLISMVISYPLN